MAKLKDILPQGEWVKVPANKVPEFKHDIFELIKIAYDAIGGHANLSNPNDIDNSDGKFYEVIDLDGDGDIEGVSVDKKTHYGDKSVAMGHDGTSPAKRSVINYRVHKLKKKGNYVECSGKIQEILHNAGVPYVDNATDVEEILGKEVDWIGNGWYYRKIGGTYHKKIMMGIPTNV